MHKEHQQQLPNEIILSIIDLFEKDLAQLHRFLTVSRFFFEAAVQRLYTNPFGLLNHDQPLLIKQTGQQRERHRTRNSALADILLGSMLLYSGQAPSHILQWFDLSIVNPQNHPFLASCLANSNDDMGNGMDYNETQEYRTVPTPTVVDYSDYLTVFPLDSTYLDWSSFFVVENQMILQPTRATSNTLHEKKSMTSSYVQRMILYLTAEHLCHLSIPIHQLFLLSLWGLPKRLASLKVLQVLIDRELDVNWAFGNLARFLGDLKLAFPDRGPLEVFLPPQLLRVAALQPLQEPDPETTTATSETTTTSSSSSSTTTTCKTLERQRNPFFEKSLAAYATLIAPCRLSVSWCPWFYQWVQKSPLELNLSRLQIFKDIRDRARLDGFNRFSREPNPIQDLALCQTFHRFLCQCPRLRRLDIFVSHVDQFDFGTEHPTSMVTRADLPRLWILTLWGDRHYQTTIGALNDAMDTFGETLKRVCVQRTRPGQDLQQQQSPSPFPGTYQSSQPPLASIALSKRCNRIGFWTMPFLCELVLQLGDVPALDVGTFGGCPQLEELTIEFGIRGWSESSQRRLDAFEHDEGLDSLSGNDPRLRVSPGLSETVEEEDEEDEEMDEDEDQDFELIRDEEEFLGQAYWFQRNPHVPTWLDSRQKFPRWSLPQLRLLVLKGRAPTLFNYESFEQGLMPNLMQVRFVESSPDHYLYFAEDEDKPRIVRNIGESGVWEDVRSHFRPRARTVESVSEALEKCSLSPASPLEVTTPDPATSCDSNHQDMDPSEAGTTPWHLPKLQSLSLKGECVFAFYWDRLLTLPALTHLTLTLPRVTSQMFEMKNVLPTLEDNEIKEREEAVSETDLARPPFLQSQLVYLSVEGDWRFSRRELQELLMVYAPYLRGMVVRSGVGFYKMEPFVFLKTMAQIHYLVKGTRYQKMIVSARNASQSADNAKKATATRDQVLDAYWLNRLGLEGETTQDLNFEKRNAGQNLRVVHYEGRIQSQDLDLLKDDYHLLQASSCSGSPASSSSSSTPSTSSSSKSSSDSRTKRGTAFFFSGKCVLRNQE